MEKKTLVVYYSRSGMTRKVGENIANILKCDVEEIVDTKSRKGFWGYLVSGFESATKKLPPIQDTRKDPSQYDIVVVGTPVWAGNMASPIRTYITRNKDRFKQVAFFCTYGGMGNARAFREMEELCGKKPSGLLDVKTMEIVSGHYIEKINKFVSGLLKF